MVFGHHGFWSSGVLVIIIIIMCGCEGWYNGGCGCCCFMKGVFGTLEFAGIFTKHPTDALVKLLRQQSPVCLLGFIEIFKGEGLVGRLAGVKPEIV